MNPAKPLKLTEVDLDRAIRTSQEPCCRDQNQGRGPDCPIHPRDPYDAYSWPSIVIYAVGIVSVVATVLSAIGGLK